MTRRITLYLLVSEGEFSIYAGSAPRDLQKLAHRTAASLGDVERDFRSEGKQSHSGPRGTSFVVGDDASDRDALGRAAMARHAVEAVERFWPVAQADALVIAAGPKMLGALRDALPKALAAKVTTELHKDLLNLPESELAQHLTA